jgi:hypothetical protein
MVLSGNLEELLIRIILDKFLRGMYIGLNISMREQDAATARKN